jgi:hypothetical protein
MRKELRTNSGVRAAISSSKTDFTENLSDINVDWLDWRDIFVLPGMPKTYLYSRPTILAAV